jgi:hypothetical protein
LEYCHPTPVPERKLPICTPETDCIVIAIYEILYMVEPYENIRFIDIGVAHCVDCEDLSSGM